MTLPNGAGTVPSTASRSGPASRSPAARQAGRTPARSPPSSASPAPCSSSAAASGSGPSRGADGVTVVEMAGLGRSESAKVPEELGDLAAILYEQAPDAPDTTDAPTHRRTTTTPPIPPTPTSYLRRRG
ncbi:hypothetical protein LV779_12820 [Streptomyces thinghirensis]|nr:hypothetical protein [Streptomyces thinghirensis]